MLNFHYVACISFGLLRSLSCEALGADWWSSNVWCATLLWNKVLFNNYISKNVLFFQSVHKITITIFHPSTSLYPPVRISLLIVGYYQIRWLLAFVEEVTRAVPRLSSRRSPSAGGGAPRPLNVSRAPGEQTRCWCCWCCWHKQSKTKPLSTDQSLGSL